MPKMETGHGTSHADAIACLQKIFAKNHTGFGSDITDENIDPGNLQYGEVTYQGMQPLYSALDLRPGDVFYDLGCGVGKLVLYVALRGDAQRSVGLEVGQRRFLLAEGARCSLDEELDSLKKTGKSQPSSTEYKFMLADISRHRYLDPTVAVLTNLCMDMGVQSRTVNCLLRCPSFRRLVSITPLLHSRLKLVRSVMVSCTWAKVSAWQVYDVLPPQEPLARSFLTTPAVIKRCTSATALKRRGDLMLSPARPAKKDTLPPLVSSASLRRAGARSLPATRRSMTSVKRSALRLSSNLEPATDEPTK
mmetsp:Transcript_33976/g.81531  ORF Transcript_33976/g.81531 Transcript_33976/m.81531 type:complete len:306 (+) Transcript_33976:75-992(+)